MVFFSNSLCFREEMLYEYSQDRVFRLFLKNWKEWISCINVVKVYTSCFQCVTLTQKDMLTGGVHSALFAITCPHCGGNQEFCKNNRRSQHTCINCHMIFLSVCDLFTPDK